MDLNSPDHTTLRQPIAYPMLYPKPVQRPEIPETQVLPWPGQSPLLPYNLGPQQDVFELQGNTAIETKTVPPQSNKKIDVAQLLKALQTGQQIESRPDEVLDLPSLKPLQDSYYISERKSSTTRFPQSLPPADPPIPEAGTLAHRPFNVPVNNSLFLQQGLGLSPHVYSPSASGASGTITSIGPSAESSVDTGSPK